MELGAQNGQEPRRDQAAAEREEQLAGAVRVVQVSEAVSDKSNEAVTAGPVFQYSQK